MHDNGTRTQGGHAHWDGRRMRLWHQSFTVLDDLPAYRGTIEEEMRNVAAPGTEVVLHGMSAETYRSAYPGDDIKYAVIQELHTQQILRNVRQADREGYDGFLLSTLPDAGLRQARSITDMPVVGYGQSAMFVAAMSGATVGIVCMIRELIPLYDDNARKFGFGARFAGAHWIGLGFDEVSAGFQDPGPVISALRDKVGELEARGIEVVIPGEAVLNAVVRKGGISRIGEVAVVDGLAATLKMGEMMVGLGRSTGLRHARVGYWSARPPDGRLDALDNYYFGANAPQE